MAVLVEDSMITIQLFPNTFLILFFLIFIVTIIIRLVKKNNSLRFFYVGIIELYVLLLISVTILPINIIDSSLMKAKSGLVNCFQLIPFRTITKIFRYDGFLSIQLIGNIVLLLPLPILIGFVVKNKSFAVLFIKCTMFSLGIEIAQVCIDLVLQYPSRRFDVDDIILNIIGILIGIVIFKTISCFEKFYHWIGENIVWTV